MDDFTSKNPRRSPLSIDQHEGDVIVPGVGRLPLVGQTGRHASEMARQAAEMRKYIEIEWWPYRWRCGRCNVEFSGKDPRFHIRKVGVRESIQTLLEMLLELKPACKCGEPLTRLERVQ